jgi:hypothetical protein
VVISKVHIKFIHPAGRLVPASEVAGGHTLPFLKRHGLPILKFKKKIKKTFHSGWSTLGGAKVGVFLV